VQAAHHGSHGDGALIGERHATVATEKSEGL
jgi:hypothetical protein